MAEALNAGCQCVSLDRQALVAALARDPRDGALQAMLAEGRPHLFSDSMAFVSARHVRRMAEVIAAFDAARHAAQPDPTALEPASHYFDAKASAEKNPWSARDVAFVETFAEVIRLPRLKACAALAELPLVQKGTRLSVMPVTAEQWQAILDLR